MSRQQPAPTQRPAAAASESAADGFAPAAAVPVARRSSLPNPADDASDLIVDWNHRHRASVTYGGEEDEDSEEGDGDDNRGNDSAAAEARGQAQTTTTSTGPIQHSTILTSRRRRSGAGGGAAQSGSSTIIDDPLIMRPPPTRNGTGTTGTHTTADTNHGRRQRETSTRGSGSSERESLFDRIGALAAAAGAGASSAGSTAVSEDRPPVGAAAASSSSRGANLGSGSPVQAPSPTVGVSSEPPTQPQAQAQHPSATATAHSLRPPASSAPNTAPATTANANTTDVAEINTAARRTVRFQQHNRILVVEGRHHYTPRETSLTWYDAADANAMRQTYTSDVRAMRRRIRRNISLDLHTYDVQNGNYSERGLEHLVSTAVYQERTDDQARTIHAVLAAQENFNARGNGGDGPRYNDHRGRRAQGEGTGGVSVVVGSSGDGYADQLARMYTEMSRETRERAAELGRADAEEAAVLWDAAEDEGRARQGGRRRSSDGRGNVGGGHNRT